MTQQFFATILPFLPWAAIIIVIIALLLLMVKVVTGNEVLVVTGVGATKKVVVKDDNGKEQITYAPKIRIAGASIVIPFIQRARRFDICVEKAEQQNDTMKTRTGVEIVLDWGISYAPNADTVESLLPCIRQFLDKDKKEIQDIVKSAVAGGMRAVISTMTPNEVMIGKETLDDLVQKNISGQMDELGYKVQIYIQEVRDASGSTYYQDLAAEDRESLKRDAANITAKANQAIREEAARTERAAKEAELESRVTIAEKEKETAVKEAGFKVEQDQAIADAEVAGKLRAAEREREVVEKNGQVEVMRQEQANLAAQKEQTVALTKAETAKREAVINAESESEQKKIAAVAAAEVALREAEGRANAVKAEASGRAEAKKTEAAANAEAVKLEAEAEAQRTSMAGQAEADAISAKGLAEAEAIKAKGKAEAEAARALSDAQAANDRVNFEIEKLRIEYDAQVQIATNVATVMARVGENAEFYDLGGSGTADGKDLMTRVMGNIPDMLKKLDLKNRALNDKPIEDSIGGLMESVLGPLGKALSGGKGADSADNIDPTPGTEIVEDTTDDGADIKGEEELPDVGEPNESEPTDGEAEEDTAVIPEDDN